MSNARLLVGMSFQNTDELVAACELVRVPLWIAVAFVEAESHGRNIYGNDVRGTFAGKGTVTQANYIKFYTAVIINHGKSNGVGPMQITWPGFLIDAMNKKVDLWHPMDNYVYGLRLIKGYLNGNYSNGAIMRAGALYNGTAAYGVTVGARASYWHGKLVPAVAPKITVLRVGLNGASITKLQLGLNKIFPSYSYLTIDGVYGPDTERVIVEFQTRLELQADGVIGPATRAALISVGIDF